ncbi:MAG TPA: lysylphosphatidylglycerol synthase transmembrane domain-containing protein [Thermoanaerobaculia bacterium]|nr:lysylphosphatidylglycerol synthase transmembrane domain-containing protein [Thermoanaerobaculia bacterium]
MSEETPARDAPEDATLEDSGVREARAAAAKATDRRHWVIFAVTGTLLALVAGGVLVALTFDAETWEALARVGPPIAGLLAALMFGSWLAAAGRIQVLTRSMGHRLRFRDALQVAICGEFGVAASPTGLGGTALRLAVLKARGVPIADGSAVVAADLLLDAGVAVLVTVIALPLAFLMPGGRPMAEELTAEVDPRLALWAGGFLAVLALAVVAWRLWSKRRQRNAEPESDTEPEAPAEHLGPWARFRRSLRHGLDRAREGLHRLYRHHPRTVAAGFALAFVQLLCRYSILPLAVVALTGPDARIFALYPLQGLLMMVAHVLVLPGGGGSVELGGAAILALYLPAHLVGAAVLLWRLFTFHWNVFLGGTVFAVTVAREGKRWAD